MSDGLERLRAICLALPEATEQLTWEVDVTFRVRSKIFATCGSEGAGVTVKADPDEHEAMLATGWEPAAYVARFGWVHRDLSGSDVDWDEIDEAVRSSYRLIAPKRLSRLLDDA